ncbi:MAG TPA: c-type cytochrome [Candidatus Acidoferrales bacterium]|nr:c-type cytochrome [Candidatus Acidoferrales bacterium]
MCKAFLAVSLLVFFGASSLAAQSDKPAKQEQKPAGQAATPAATAYVIPPEDAKKANPVKATADSIAEGKRMYGYDCAMCHGENGDGKGDLATDMKLNLKDYRDAATLKEMTDGEIFYIIQKGKGQMPSEGDRQKSNEIWNIVNFIRSLAKKSPPPKTN